MGVPVKSRGRRPCRGDARDCAFHIHVYSQKMSIPASTYTCRAARHRDGNNDRDSNLHTNKSRVRQTDIGPILLASLLLPQSGRIAKAQRIAGTKSQDNELIKNSQTGLCRVAQAEPASQWVPRQSRQSPGTRRWRSARSVEFNFMIDYCHLYFVLPTTRGILRLSSRTCTGVNWPTATLTVWYLAKGVLISAS